MVIKLGSIVVEDNEKLYEMSQELRDAAKYVEEN